MNTPRPRHTARTALLAAALLAGILPAGAQELPPPGSPPQGTMNTSTPGGGKIDAGLRMMVEHHRAALEAAGPGGTPDVRALTDGSLYFRLVPGRNPFAPDARVFIDVADQSAIGALEADGVTVETRAGEILVARIPVDRVTSVAALPSVRSIGISGESRPFLDLSRPAANAATAHSGGGGLDRPYRGNGALVGVLDSGIDWAHPDFSNATNDTRIRWLLDYGNAGSTGNPTEWTKAQIDAGQCTEVDGQGGYGHGTHVAGAAAGNGRRNAAYIGMAPAAEILAVKGIRDPQSQGGFADADVVNGVAWMLEKAQQLGRPIAVNLSLGGHFGPHDGTGNYERALSNLTGPGRVIVAAAGNEGGDFIHSSYATSGTSYLSAPETPMEVAQGAQVAAVDIWYPQSGTISVGIAAYHPQTGQLLDTTRAVAPGQSIQNVTLTDGGGTPIAVVSIDARTTSDPNNGARNVLVVLQSPHSGVLWSVYTFGSGTMDKWVVTGARFISGGLPGSQWRYGDNTKSVGIPATAKKVICVGSYVTKVQWVDFNGQTRTQTGATLGQISRFSSRGPSRDGRTKPDVVAPGEAIIAPLSSGYTPDPSDILQGGGLHKLQGTSMASPHVTGIVALLLEKNKYLDYESAVAILKSTATASGDANTWGSGRVNAVAALQATPAAIDCATLARLTGYDCDGNRVDRFALVDAYPNPFNPATTVGFVVPRNERVELAIHNTLGQKVRTLLSGDVAAGFHQAVWDGRTDAGSAAASGVYYVRMAAPGFSAARRLVLVK